MVKLDPIPGGCVLTTPFDRSFVQALKAVVPSEARQYQTATRQWLIDTRYVAPIVGLVYRYFGETLVIPAGAQVTTPATEVRLLRVEYLGRAKVRDGGDLLAYAWVDGGWNALFPQRVLQEWFSALPVAPEAGQTYFAILGIAPQSSAADIKTAYRRLARQWHPDVTREPGAKETFLLIQEAYEVLQDEQKRRKYLAGLTLEASLRTASTVQHTKEWEAGYRAPLRCGMVLVEGTPPLGRFLAQKILQWEDIVRGDGKTLVTSWPIGAEKFVETWV